MLGHTCSTQSQLWLTDEALEGFSWVRDRLTCVCLALQIPRNMQDFLLSVVAGLLFFPTGLTASGRHLPCETVAFFFFFGKRLEIGHF